MTNFFSELHIEKAKVPISVTVFGIIIFFKELQSAKAFEAIFVKFLETNTSVSELHQTKAHFLSQQHHFPILFFLKMYTHEMILHQLFLQCQE